MKSRRDSILILCIVLIAAILAGCGAAEQRPALDRIEYTNLNDSGSRAVSYTHLDVYKRQVLALMGFERHTEKVSGSEYHVWFYRVRKGE